MNAAPLTLTGRRVELTPLTVAHLDPLCAVGLAPELWEFTTIQVKTRDDMAAYIQRALEQQAAGITLPFVIVERATNRVIGSTRYYALAPEHRRLEIGFTFIAPPWQRTGINPEVKLLMLQQAFDGWGCLRVQLTANAINARSRGALRRLGAVEEGIFRHHRVSPDRGLCDIAVHSIIASEWPKVRAGLQQRLAAG